MATFRYLLVRRRNCAPLLGATVQLGDECVPELLGRHRLLVGDEFAVDDDIRVPVRDGVHVSTGFRQGVDRIELHIAAEAFGTLKCFLLASRRDGYVITGLGPVLSYRARAPVACNPSLLKGDRVAQGRKQHDWSVADNSSGAASIAEGGQDRAEILILDQIHHRCMSARVPGSPEPNS